MTFNILQQLLNFLSRVNTRVHKKRLIQLMLFCCLFFFSWNSYSQPVPNVDENIPFLVVFGKKAPTSWGDDDFSQTFFF